MQDPSKFRFDHFEGGIFAARVRTPAVVNPAVPLCPVFERRENNPDADDRGWVCDYVTHSNKNHAFDEVGREFNPSTQASSMGMYLTNPPCRQACIHFKVHSECLPSNFLKAEFSALLEREDGITVGDLLTFASEVRGKAIVKELDPDPDYTEPHETYENVTLNWLLKSLNPFNRGPSVLCGKLRCDLLDTIIPTDRMRAGVAPYVETGGLSKYPEDEGWETSDYAQWQYGDSSGLDQGEEDID